MDPAISYTHPMAGVYLPDLCGNCENAGGLGECLQVPLGLTPSWPDKRGVSVGADVVWCQWYRPLDAAAREGYSGRAEDRQD